MHHKADKDDGAQQAENNDQPRVVEFACKTEPQRRTGKQRHRHIDDAVFAAIQNINHGAHRGFAFVLRFPVLSFRNIFPQPQGKDDGQNADKEQRPPAPDGHDKAVDLGRNHGADGETGNQKTTRLVAQVLWPAFNHIGCAGAIFPRHPHAYHHAGDKQGDVTRRKTAGQRTAGKEHDAGDHRQLAAIAVAHGAQQQAAEPARYKGRRNQARRFHCRQGKLAFYFCQD